jgi:hypothetical protein
LCKFAHFICPPIDISGNRLTRIDGLDVLPQLSNLNVSQNSLSTACSIENLSKCKRLTSIDFSHNNLEGEDVIETLSRIPALLSINMAGNPVVSTVSHFRKKTIVAVKTLRYLDRPIFDLERLSSEAWSTGGRDAELKTKTEWQVKLRLEERNRTETFRQWQDSIREKALEDKLQFETNPTAQQILDEEEKQRRINERKAKASEAAAKERDIYRIDVSTNVEDERLVETMKVESDEIDDCKAIPFPAKEMNQSHCPSQEEEKNSSALLTKQQMTWNGKMDGILKKFVLEHDFSFEKVSAAMKNEFDDQEFDSEMCRLRWCLLDSSKDQAVLVKN